jgi:hypothetical protein
MPPCFRSGEDRIGAADRAGALGPVEALEGVEIVLEMGLHQRPLDLGEGIRGDRLVDHRE